MPVKANDLIAIVESPLQLINASEFSKSTLNSVLFIDLGNQRNREICVQLANYFGHNLIIINPVGYFYQIKSLFSAVIILAKTIKYSTVVFGDIRNTHFRIPQILLNFIGARIVIVDDGNNGIYDINKYEQLVNNKYIVFSAFINKNWVQRNNYTYLKKMIETSAAKSHDVFIGSSIVQTKAASFESYLNLVKYAAEKSHVLLYFPHRLESKSQLSSLNEIQNVRIIYSDFPIELMFLNFYIPKNVFSICSSALFTLMNLYEIENILMFVLDGKWLDTDKGKKMRFIETAYMRDLLINSRDKVDVRFVKV